MKKIDSETKKSKRITVMIDYNNSKQLRGIQAEFLKKDSKNASFSRVINKILKIGLKNYKV